MPGSWGERDDPENRACEISLARLSPRLLHSSRGTGICYYGYLTVNGMQFDGREAGLDLIIGVLEDVRKFAQRCEHLLESGEDCSQQKCQGYRIVRLARQLLENHR